MTAEEIVKAAREAGFSSSEIFQRLAEFKRLIESAAAAEREACATIDVTPINILASDGPGTAILKYIAAIRARGNP